MAPAGGTVGGTVALQNPALVIEHPRKKWTSEIEEGVVAFAFDAIGVTARLDGFARGAGKQPLVMADEDDALTFGWIPTGTEAVEFDCSAVPVFAIAAAAFGEGGVFFEALESGGDELVAAGMAGVASPEAHGL